MPGWGGEEEDDEEEGRGEPHYIWSSQFHISAPEIGVTFTTTMRSPQEASTGNPLRSFIERRPSVALQLCVCACAYVGLCVMQAVYGFGQWFPLQIQLNGRLHYVFCFFTAHNVLYLYTQTQKHTNTNTHAQLSSFESP